MMKFSTKAVHMGNPPDPTTGAVIPPIYMTSTYIQEAPGETKGYDYTRAGNPNFTSLETTLASLEHGAYATVFSSGLGTLTAMLSTLSQGDKVLAFHGLYGGSYRLFTQVFQKFGIEFISILPKSKKELEEHLRAIKPKWLFFETPTNPLLDVFDIELLAECAKKYGALTLVDNTFATPYFQNPLKWGADIVWHSTTKYIGGHSDVIGGVAITNDMKIKEQLDFARKAVGVNPSPFDVWLVSRGVKTLALRMEQHQKNAQQVAVFLQKHPKVKRVYYPGLKDHPHHEVAKKQMTGFGGMVSAEFIFSFERMKKFFSLLELFSLGESLGGVESLISHSATMTHASLPQSEREKVGLNDQLVRLSVGIEDPEDLIQDLENALEQS